MFVRIRDKLSLLFNRDVVITRRFEKREQTPVNDGRTGKFAGFFLPINIQAWGIATPVGNDQYTVQQKELITHNQLLAFPKAALTTSLIDAAIGKTRKSIFSHSEAMAVLKLLENNLQKDGYMASAKQPFKKRIYTLPSH